MASQTAEQYGLGTTTLFNLVKSESEWNPDADNGHDRGLVQISRKWFPFISDTQAFDPAFALDFAASKIADGEEYLWTVCSCTKYAHVLQPAFPIQNADTVVPNSLTPNIGSVAVFRYKSGKSHVGVVDIVQPNVVQPTRFHMKQSNYKPCLTDGMWVDIQDPSLVGFWDPYL